MPAKLASETGSDTLCLVNAVRAAREKAPTTSQELSCLPAFHLQSNSES